jgi:hypothetical protein
MICIISKLIVVCYLHVFLYCLYAYIYINIQCTIRYNKAKMKVMHGTYMEKSTLRVSCDSEVLEGDKQ